MINIHLCLSHHITFYEDKLQMKIDVRTCSIDLLIIWQHNEMMGFIIRLDVDASILYRLCFVGQKATFSHHSSQAHTMHTFHSTDSLHVVLYCQR